MGCSNSHQELKKMQEKIDKLESKIKKNSNYQSKINNLQQSLDNIYRSCKAKTQSPQQLSTKFIKQIQNQISLIYKQLIQGKLISVHKEIITFKQLKNQISWEIVRLNISIIKCMLQDPELKLDKSKFQQLYAFQKKMIDYLKRKYPRGDDLDAGQLSKYFKQMDMTQDFKNDILGRAKICFVDNNDVKIKKNIKTLINCVIDETNRSYPLFQQLMTKQIFTIPNKTGKINRKISENVSKYKKLNTPNIQIYSFEIFRVLVKWMQALLDLLKKPRGVITQKVEWKFVSIGKQIAGDIKFIQCNKSQSQQLIKNKLIQNIQQANSSIFQKKKQDWIIQNDKFIISILKTLQNIQNHSTHLSQRQIQIMKFSELNTNIIMKNVEEKLVEAIKILINVGQNYKKQLDEQNRVQYLDLVKFKVTDLMRCRFQGTRDQIIVIYDNFKRLDKQKKIEIVKIKNRFLTQLCDAMILFKLPSSFLICQCQLQLTEHDIKEDKKRKNIENLNHFLYELERSPFGVLGQASLLLKYRSNLLKYIDKIQAQGTFDYQKCKKQHPAQALQIQQTYGFICSSCLKYRPPYSNILKIKHCKKCYKFSCNECSNSQFQKNKIIQQKITKQLYHRIVRQNQTGLQKQSLIYKILLRQQEQETKIRLINSLRKLAVIYNDPNYKKEVKKSVKKNDKSSSSFSFLNLKKSSSEPLVIQKKQQHTLNVERLTNQQIITTFGIQKFSKQQQIKEQSIINQIFESYHPPTMMSKIFKTKNIKTGDLIRYLVQKYEQILKQQQVIYIYFVVAYYNLNKYNFRCYRCDLQDDSIMNVEQQIQMYQSHDLFKVNDLDVLITFKSVNLTQNLQKQHLDQIKNFGLDILQNGAYLFQEMNKKYIYKKYMNGSDSTDSISNNDRNIYENNYSKINNKNGKIITKKPIYEVLYIPLTEPKQTYLILDINNIQRSIIKQPNIQSFLDDPGNIKFKFKRCGIHTPFLEDYYKNNIQFRNHFNHVFHINLSFNHIDNISLILKNCPHLQTLNLKSNQIQKVQFVQELKQLRSLNLSANKIIIIKKIENISNVQDINLSNNSLQQIFISNPQNFSKFENFSITEIFSWPKSLNKNKNEEPRYFSFPNLANLKIRSNKLRKIEWIDAPKLVYVDISKNSLAYVKQFLKFPYPALKKLFIHSNPLQKIPKIDMPQLIQISFSNTQIDSNSKFFQSQLPKIVKIQLQDNSNLHKLPDVQKFQTLQYLYLRHNPISIISGLQKLSVYKKLKLLQITIKAHRQQFKIIKQKLEGIKLPQSKFQITHYLSQ